MVSLFHCLFPLWWDAVGSLLKPIEPCAETLFLLVFPAVLATIYNSKGYIIMHKCCRTSNEVLQDGLFPFNKFPDGTLASEKSI